MAENHNRIHEYGHLQIDAQHEENVKSFLNVDINQRYFSIVVKEKKLHLKANRFVGIAQIGELRIEVFPKIYQPPYDLQDEGNRKRIFNNFLVMLNYVYKIKNIKQFDSSFIGDNFDFFEVMIYLYAKNLLDLLKSNSNRTYETVEEESGFLKGTWRLSEQLAKAPHLKHRFFVSYDEFTENNLLNRILKYVATLLVYKTNNTHNRNLLQNIILFFTEIDDIPKPDKTTLSKVQFTRLNIEFKPVFNLAKMFIEKIVTGQNQSKDKTFSFMFDMNVLFEQFIAGLISEIDFSGTEYAGSKIYKPSYENYLAIKQPENDKEKEKKAFALQPDILFKKDNKTKLIIDTKYKLLDEEEKNYGISQVDAYQMYAYAKKYDCPTVIMLYPKHINICDIRNEYSFDENKKLQIRIIDICINLKDKKDDLIKELKNIINYNKE